jgi:hypothetical protein
LTFTTFQTLREGAQKFPPGFFDYIIYDEVHHMEADTYKKVVDYFQPKFQLGLTATPNRMDRRDIMEHFGEPLYSKTLPEAIGEGYLANVEYNVMFDDAVKRALKDGFQPRNTAEIKALFDVRSRNEVIADKIHAAQDKIRQDEGIDIVKTIVFSDDIDTADEFAELLGGQSYHSRLKEKEQHKIFEAFVNGDTENIAVRDMFNEGVDIPDARLIIFLRTTQSKTVFEQQLGRGLRKTRSKEKVTVLDFVANIDRLIMLEELADVIFKEDAEKSLEVIDDVREDAILEDEFNRFIFDKDIINLLHAYNQLMEKEGRIMWSRYSNDKIVQLALSISPDKPITVADLYEMGRNTFPGISTIYRMFGSLGNFQRACGFEVKNWDDVSNDDIIEIAKKMSPDKPLTVTDVRSLKDNELPSSYIIRARFGTWIKFQQECSFDVIDWTEFSNEDLIELAKQLSPEAVMSKSMVDEIAKNEFPSSTTIARRFGSMAEFHKACGFDPSIDWSRYDNQDLIDLALSISPNAPLSLRDISILERTEFPNYTVIYDRFVSIINFQRACGFTIKPKWGQYTDEELGQLARELSPDKPMNGNDIQAFDNTVFPSLPFIQKRFGKIATFQRASGFEITNEGHWRDVSDEEIIEIAKSLSLDKMLTRAQIDESPASVFPSMNLIYSRFGTLRAFQELCGFETKHRPNWSEWSNEDLIARALELSPNEPLTHPLIDKLSRFDFPTDVTIVRRFGTWKAFIEACGF